VHQDFAELGRRAVGLLLGELGGDSDNAQHRIVPELVIRDSTGSASSLA
jgi:DNA-binding LacI/PurR family transcriptional regulator